MKKGRVALWLILSVMLVLAAGCTGKAKINKTSVSKLDERKVSIEKYIGLWEKKDYNSMYDMLSQDSKKNMTLKDYSGRLNNIYNSMDAQNITVTPKYPKAINVDKDGKVHIPFSLTMDTIAGKVTFDSEAILVNDKVDKNDNWDIVWNEKLIFPQMDLGDKVGVQRYTAKRGEIDDRNGKQLAVGTLKRSYPYKEAAAHLIGYVKMASADELKTLSGQGYVSGDYVGEAGLEKVFEKRLRGDCGGIIYTRDSNGNKKVTVAEKKATDGENIKLTIDIDVQQALYDQLKNDSGCAVAVQPKTGETLAMVSTPSYDPNLFVTGISQSQWNAITNNAGKPLLNRFAGAYAPGSTFKPITASIGIKSGKLNPDTAVSINGYNWKPNSSWGNYSITRVDNITTPENLQTAFIYSDNIYFAQTALKIGSDTFLSEAKNLGIGEKIPFEYPMQASQISNDGNLKGEIPLADSGYGQAQVQMNPLQLAMIYGGLVNGGTIMKPYLEVNSSNAGIWENGVIPENACSTIINDLVQVVQNPAGTGHGAYTAGLKLAGKTGTAEIKTSQNDKNGTENGWFVSVNPDNPKLLIAMMIENVKSRGGSHYVVPKVANVMKQFANR